MGIVDCLDTHVLIWGVKKQAESTQKFMIERTSNFIQWMENEGHTIIVPAPVLAEFLMRIPVADHPAINQAFEKRFIISPFDARVASVFAGIWQKNAGLRKTTGPTEPPSREEIKVDCMIVAVAVANHAHVLYSEDPHIRKIADGFIPVRDIPKIPRQPNLI